MTGGGKIETTFYIELCIEKTVRTRKVETAFFMDLDIKWRIEYQKIETTFILNCVQGKRGRVT